MERQSIKRTTQAFLSAHGCIRCVAETMDTKKWPVLELVISSPDEGEWTRPFRTAHPEVSSKPKDRHGVAIQAGL
jgi:hypothetical protein